jgi:predicted Zn-ribbon and HTH transcriptional regulator
MDDETTKRLHCKDCEEFFGIVHNEASDRISVPIYCPFCSSEEIVDENDEDLEDNDEEED